jgi:hypothetical protein
MCAAVFVIVTMVVLIIAGIFNAITLAYCYRDFSNVKYTLARNLQTSGHFFSMAMAFSRAAIVYLGESNIPKWIGAIFSISSFFTIFSPTLIISSY